MTTLLAIFTLAVVLSLILTPIAGLLGRWGKAIDKPDGIRKFHQTPTPRTGGIALGFSFALSLVAVNVFIPSDVSKLLNFTTHTWHLTGAGLMVFCVGLWDDYKRLNHHIKFLIQIIAATFVYAGGTAIHHLICFDLSDLPLLSYLITVLWILFFINAVNLLDGLDGLSAGVCLFCSLTMVILSITRKDMTTACLFAALSGTLIGFLRYNSNPARIFMGDGGSYLLGYIIAVISLSSSNKSQTGASLLITVLAMGIPAFDTILSPIRRFLTGKGPFKPDRGHIHHKFINHLGFSPRHAVWMLYGITGMLCTIALIVVNIKDELAGVILIMLGACAFLFVHKLGYISTFDFERITNWICDIGYVAGISKKRRTFLWMQLSISESRHEREFWSNLCAVLEWLEFDYAEMNHKIKDGEAIAHTWNRGKFDVDLNFYRHHLFKLELPLADENHDFGTIWLVKDIRRKPISRFTMIRVEQLRRTIKSTLKMLNGQQPAQLSCHPVPTVHANSVRTSNQLIKP